MAKLNGTGDFDSLTNFQKKVLKAIRSKSTRKTMRLGFSYRFGFSQCGECS